MGFSFYGQLKTVTGAAFRKLTCYVNGSSFVWTEQDLAKTWVIYAQGPCGPHPGLVICHDCTFLAITDKFYFVSKNETSR